MKNNNSCNICNSLNSKILYKKLDFSCNICKDCGHVFQSNRKSQEYYNTIPYTVAQQSVYDVTHVAYDKHAENRGNYIYDFIKSYLEDKKIDSLLDIGSGYGGVVYYLNKHIEANQVVGITPDYDENTFNNYSGIKFIKSTYDSPIENKFDVIILVHTLEHFINPINPLLNAKKNLSDDGLFYIEVPSFYWESFRIKQVYTPVHLSYFTKNGLLKILGDSGFEVLRIKESKFWGNIKIIAKHKDNNKTYLKNQNENWILKLLKLKLNKLFMYPLYKIIKKFFKVLPNS